MRRTFGALALAAAVVGLSGCLSHVAAREDSGSLGILWREDFEAARLDARGSGRPMLAVLVAGELRDKC